MKKGSKWEKTGEKKFPSLTCWQEIYGLINDLNNIFISGEAIRGEKRNGCKKSYYIPNFLLRLGEESLKDC